MVSLPPPAQVIRDITFAAKFVSAPAFGGDAHFACFDVPTWFKKKHTAVWTQSMDAGETAEFTLWPKDKVFGATITDVTASVTTRLCPLGRGR